MPMSTPHRAVWSVLLITAILYLPSLLVGFFVDDYTWLASLDPSLTPQESVQPAVGPYYLQLTDPDARAFWQALGVAPWWASTAFRWTLLRPAATWMLQLQWSLFGAWPLGYHLLSWLCYLGLVAGVGRLYARLLPGDLGPGYFGPGYFGPRDLGGLALFLFATHIGHLQSVWLLCNQHSLLAVTAALLGLLAHLRWQESGWKPGLPLSLLGFSVGLLFGETTVSLAAYVLTYALVGSTARWHERVRSLVPLTVLLSGYLVAHHVLGYTSQGSLLYLDPAGDPRALLEASVSRLPSLLGGLWGVFLADFWLTRPSLRDLLAVVGVLTTLGIALLLRACWPGLTALERKTVAWMGAGACLSLLPGLASPPGGRLLLVPTLGSSLVLAVLFRQGWRLLQSTRDASHVRSSPNTPPERAGKAGSRLSERAFLVGVAPLMGLHGLLLPLAIPLLLLGMGRLTWDVADAYRSAALNDRLTPAQDLIVLNLPSASFSMTFLSARRVLMQSPLPRSWSVLASAPHALRARRTDAQTLELTLLEGAFIAEGFERLFRPQHWPVKVGDRFEQDRLTATVLTLSPEGPTSVAFRFRTPLDASSTRLLSWQAGALREIPMLAVGQMRNIPAGSSPLGPGL